MKFFMGILFSLLLCSSTQAAEVLEKMAKQLSKEMQKMKGPRVGILAFPYHDGKISSGCSIVSERLTTYLASIKGVRVIERNLIKKLLEEQHLSETGVLDPNTAKQLGKILGVDVMVIGTLIDLVNNETEVNARSIKVNSGEVMSASQAVIKRSWSDAPKLARPPQLPESSSEEEEESASTNEPIRIGVPGGRGGRGGYR